MAFPGKFRGRVHLDACRTGFMICPGLGPGYGRPYYDDRWGDESDWIDGEAAWSLFKAGTAGDLAAIEALLDEDLRLVNALHWYAQPVHMAARHGHADAVQLLLDRSADPGLNIFNSTWASLLENARVRGFDDVTDVLENAMNDRFGYDPAFREIADLIKAGGFEGVAFERVASVLRDRPELARRADEDGNSGLHLGVLNGRKDLIELFLDRGVPIDSRRADGKTPLTCPSMSDSDSIRPIRNSASRSTCWRRGRITPSRRPATWATSKGQRRSSKRNPPKSTAMPP